jgi:DNA-binding FrmR family transcriptional regulator
MSGNCESGGGAKTGNASGAAVAKTQGRPGMQGGSGTQGRRQAHHGQVTKAAVAARLRKIEGQVRGIARMVEADVYCDEVLNQITAVEAALSGVRRLLLEAHIRSCVVEQIEEGRHEVIDELMKTIGRMTR